MKEAIANAGVFNLIIIFVIILMAFFVGSLGYSKAFKVKNYIINEIEKNEGYDDSLQEEIDSWLSQVGYRLNAGVDRRNCPTVNGESAINNRQSDYQYCIYKFETSSETKNSSNVSAKQSTYYRVIAYMYFDVPIINDLIRIPVTGETISFTTINS